MAEGMLAEAPILWKNGWPTTLAKLAEFMPATILLWLVGPLGPEAVAIAGMGSFWVNVTGVSMVVGFGIGMIPLASQAYGAKNYERVGAILVRQQCIHLLVSTGVLALWWNTEAALDALDQPSFIASGTAEFVRWRMPALPFLVLNQNFSSFLQCQRVFKPMMYVGIVMNPISILLFWLMITKLEMGTMGGALALTLCDALRAILNYFATRIYGNPHTLPNYCSAALWSQVFDIGGIVELLKLSLPGALTVWSEWWAWECCVVMAGWLCAATAKAATAPVEDECAPLAAQPILGNTMVLGFMVTFGVNTAACTQVGNYLGAVSTVSSPASPDRKVSRSY
jgi:MATE family multidrug resistance protein